MIKFFYDGEGMRNKNGFIFIETIIAIIILMASFMTLFNMYNKVYHKLDNRIRYDNLSLIYKANVTKQSLDNFSDFELVYKNLVNEQKLITNIGINTEGIIFNDSNNYLKMLNEFKISNVFLIYDMKQYREQCLNKYLQAECGFISFDRNMTDYLSSIKNSVTGYTLLIETRIKDNGQTCYEDNKDNLCSPEYTYLEVYYPSKIDVKKKIVDVVLNSGELWDSKLEGDGLRYVGVNSDKMCSYDSGAYYKSISKDTPKCPSIIKYIMTEVGVGYPWPAAYEDTCPKDTAEYTYECTEINDGEILKLTNPNNYICFGTSSTIECKANEGKYMYRIIGVFPDEEGNQHLKLRKLKHIGYHKWNDTLSDIKWADSSLYSKLNGSSFLTNSNYNYLQSDKWLNKIKNWKWTTTRTQSFEYWDDYNPANIYLHEMNRSTKTSTVGEWTYPTGKIGLTYASDYALSLGDYSLAIQGSIHDNMYVFQNSWMKTDIGWFITSNKFYKDSYGREYYRSYYVDNGDIYFDTVTKEKLTIPVFYLAHDVTLTTGTGTYDDPYIIEE